MPGSACIGCDRSVEDYLYVKMDHDLPLPICGWCMRQLRNRRTELLEAIREVLRR